MMSSDFFSGVHDRSVVAMGGVMMIHGEGVSTGVERVVTSSQH